MRLYYRIRIALASTTAGHSGHALGLHSDKISRSRQPEWSVQGQAEPDALYPVYHLCGLQRVRLA